MMAFYKYSKEFRLFVVKGPLIKARIEGNDFIALASFNTWGKRDFLYGRIEGSLFRSQGFD